MIKNQYCCFCTKTQYSFILNFMATGLGKNVCVYVCVCVCVCLEGGGVERSLNK